MKSPRILTTNQQLQSFLTNALFNQHDLVRAGIPSEQATAIVTNEQDLMNYREANDRSQCCNSPVIHDLLNDICSGCGCYCQAH